MGLRQRRCQIQELLRGKNQNALKGIKDQQICIAGDELSCPTAHCYIEKLIVLGVAARLNLDIHVNPLRPTRQSRYKTSRIVFVNVPAEMFSVQNIVEFRERRK